MKQSSQFHSNRGVTLMEMLVTVAIAGIVFAIALPTFGGLIPKGYAAVAEADARNTSNDLLYIVRDYNMFGSENGTITVNQAGYLVFSPMNGADPEPSGPGTTSLLATLSQGSTFFAGTYGGGQTPHWCITIKNKDSKGVYADGSFVKNGTGCAANGTPTVSN